MSVINSSTDFIVEGVLWTLVAFSVVTWTLVVVKAVQYFRLKRQNLRFTRQFWTAADLSAAAELSSSHDGPIARLAGAGFNAVRDGDGTTAHDLEHSGDRQNLLERYLRQQIQRDRRSLESGLAVLASIGSTSPFIGLFGTVWGIMHALTAISESGSASLDVVAGPIGEALIATGVGIAVAVPAVLAYNYFVRRLKLTSADLDDFANDFISLAQKASFRVKTRPVASIQDTQDGKKEVFA